MMAIANSAPKRHFAGNPFKRVAVLLGFMLLAVVPAWAIDLEQAKDQGLVGETESGYLEPVVAATPEIRDLVDTINQKRRAEYRRIASSNDIDLATVEALAGKKAIEKTPSGQYVKVRGAWRKK